MTEPGSLFVIVQKFRENNSLFGKTENSFSEKLS